MMLAPSGRILLIDDDQTFLQALAEALQRHNRHVSIEIAQTEQEGLRLMKVDHFDAIVTDVCMPGINGLALLKEAASRVPGTPVILLTGYSSPSVQEEARKYGAYAVLDKPVDSDVLYSAVTRSILRSHLLRPECKTTTAPQVDRTCEALGRGLPPRLPSRDIPYDQSRFSIYLLPYRLST